MNSNVLPRIVVLFVILAGALWLSLARTRPPAVVPESAPETEFSAARAMNHVTAISQKPHVTGSPEIYEVRDYILGELTRLGLEAETQNAVAQALFNPRKVAWAENIVARIPGADSSRAILLIGHYDTVPNTPGAGDDGVAVATMLETARALTAGPPLANDVVLLFSDAEEPTIAGAIEALEHPWLSEVGLVLNLEMRGRSGPVYMFETGPENGWIVPEFAKAVPYPNTSSLMRDVYNNMPNNTDFTAFRDAGYAGFNFGALEGFTHYHSALDTPEDLNPRSVQHHGSYALGIARHFGNLDLSDPEARDAVYFDLLGRTLIRYPGFLAIPLMILAVLLFIGVGVFGRRRGRLTIRGMGWGFLAFLVVIVTGPGAVTLLWFLIRGTVNPPIINGDTFNSPLYFLGFGLLILAITAALYGLFRRWVSTPDLAMGALLWWMILLVGVTFVFPMANFLFLWPLLFALLGVGYSLLTDEQEPLTWSGVTVLAVAALPGVLLIPPTTLSVAMGLLALVSVTGASLALVSLLLGLLVPHLTALTWSDSGLGRWWLPAGSALTGIVVVLGAMAGVRVDADHPRVIHLIYGLDTETGEAIWASEEYPEFTREWTGPFFSEQATSGRLPRFFGNARLQFTIDEAPVVSLSPPEVVVLEDVQEGDLRSLRLSVTSTRGATYAGFYLEPPAEVLSATINGEPVKVPAYPPDRENRWELQYWGPLTGMELGLEIGSPQAIKLFVVERVSGLPEIPEQAIEPQPDHLIPFAGAGNPSHVTLVSSSWTFE